MKLQRDEVLGSFLSAHIDQFENETNRAPAFTLHTKKVASTAKSGIVLDNEGKEVDKGANNTSCSQELSFPNK